MFYGEHFKVSYLFTPKSGQKSEIIKICKIKKIHFAKSWKQLVPFERAAKGVSFEWLNHRISRPQIEKVVFYFGSERLLKNLLHQILEPLNY